VKPLDARLLLRWIENAHDILGIPWAEATKHTGSAAVLNMRRVNRLRLRRPDVDLGVGPVLLQGCLEAA
jgi:hypothetical protein